MRRPALLLLSLAFATALPAASVSLPPDLSFPGPAGHTRTLRSLHGQPVVLIITDSPKTKPFLKQLKMLRRGYSQFASRQAIFMVAFRDGSPAAESNVPFVVLPNGENVAQRYGVKENFNVVIVGVDGNLDYQTAQVVPPERMLDVMQNNFAAQSGTRKDVER